jgi:DNA mismatch repair ATPase MutS
VNAAFYSFEELGFEDYIFPLKLKIKGKIFPPEKYSFGDLNENDPIQHPNCFPSKKQYKNFVLNSLLIENNGADVSEITNSGEATKIIFNNLEKIIKDTISEKSVSDIIEKTIENKINNTVNNKTEKTEQTFNNQTDITEKVEKTHSSETNIDNSIIQNNNVQNNIDSIIKNQINQSSNYTMETLIQLENNVKQLNNKTINNNITRQEFKDYKKVVKTDTKNIEKEIENNKNYLMRFLNS